MGGWDVVKKQTGTTRKSGMKLLIVESPAKIKTISKFLGKDFKIMSTFGHIKDLPSKKLGIKINEKTKKISLEYEVLKDKQEKITDICKQASKCSEVYLASDPDREGEIISWHISQEIEKVVDPENIYRITFNEITKDAIEEAINNKTVVDEKKVEAQQARRILDRWVGYEVSPILWRKIAKGLSAGRVQSVAVLLVCKREQEIISFKPEESWSIHANFLIIGNAELPTELFKIKDKAFKLTNKDEADKTLASAKKEDYVISKITEKELSKKAAPPFMTSTLQQDAFNKLGFSVDKTMSVAQRLYEGIPLSDKNQPEALITYMRTDSLRIADSALKSVRSYIKKEYGDKYVPSKANMYSKAGAQDAHEAVRPINVEITPKIANRYLKKDEARLYELIWKRFVACQMTPAVYFQRQVLLLGGIYTFKATGSTLMFEGFLKVYLAEDEDEEKIVKIPKDIKEKDTTKLKEITNKQHFTQPPPRYSEATLVKEMEKLGIGRPSTYAATLSTIQKRNYVERDTKKRFSPTELGKAVDDLLVKNLPDIINVSFTAQMEENLDKIAQGEIDRDKTLNEFYVKFKKDLTEFGGSAVTLKSVDTGLSCPECKAPLVTRFGKTGEFAGCSKYPECKFTSNVKRDEAGAMNLAGPTETEITNEICPNCSKTLVKKMGRFGPFLACPGYPDCKHIHQDALKKPCPQCGGKITKRRWRGGSFWGCSNYPTCKFSIFGEVEERPCPKCKTSWYLNVVKDKKTETVKAICPDKACGYTEEKESSEGE